MPTHLRLGENQMINVAYELRLARMRSQGIDTSKFEKLLKELKNE